MPEEIHVEITNNTMKVLPEIETVQKNGKISYMGKNNKKTEYDYATVDDVYLEVREKLAAANVALMHTCGDLSIFEYDQKHYLVLDVYVWTADDKSDQCHYPMPLEKVSHQAVQAVVSMAIKYFLRGRQCLATGELDADAVKPPEGTEHGAPTPSGPKKLTRTQINFVMDLARTYPEMSKVLKLPKKTSLLTEEDYAAACDYSTTRQAETDLEGSFENT